MATLAFAGAATPDPSGTWHVPEGWNQGRGAWGGLVVTAGIRAAMAIDADRRPVRSVSATLAAPVPPGPAMVQATPIRRGSATGTWRVDIREDGAPPDGAVLAHLVVLGGAARRDVDAPAPRPAVDARMPDVPDWGSVEAVPIGPPIGPDFARHLHFRPVRGLPYSGTGDPVECWIAPRPEESGGARASYDAASLIGMVDALWPAVLTWLPEVRPVATVEFTASLLVDPASVDPAEPLLHDGAVIATSEGYVTEVRRLWTADGRLAVHNHQVVALIR